MSLGNHRRTALYLILGGPDAAARSPPLWNTRFQASGRNAMMAPLLVSADQVANAFNLLRDPASNLAGVVITTPYKRVASELVDHLEGDAAALRIVNAVKRSSDGSLVGALFDGETCVSLAGNVFGKRAFVVGAGSAGMAIARALVRSGAKTAMRDVSPSALESAASLLGSSVVAGFDDADLCDADIVVNATALGEHTFDDLPFKPQSLDPAAVVVDLAGGNTGRLGRLTLELKGQFVGAEQFAAAQAPLLIGFFDQYSTLKHNIM